jgi:integrase
MDVLTKDGERGRSPQRVFVHDPLSVKHGIPASLVGCPFICDINHDRRDENTYLKDLYEGTFRKHRLTSPPGWMDRSAGRGMGEDSLLRHAQALSFGCRLLDQLNTDLLRFEEHDLARIAELMAGCGQSWISAVQTAVVMAAQNCVWRGLRQPLILSFSEVRTRSSRPGRKSTVLKIDLIKRPKRKAVRYIGARQGRIICEEIRDPACRIAVKLCFRSGLRPGEPGLVQDALMPDGTNSDPEVAANFAVTGKGNKERFPEVDADLVTEIDQYRAFVRPERVANYLRLNSTSEPPSALLLNTRGDPLTYPVIYAAFREAAVKLKIKGVPHWARHAYAADFLVNAILTKIEGLLARGIELKGRDIKTFEYSARMRLMENLGHADEGSTDGYLTRVDAAVSAHLQVKRRGAEA